MASFISTNQSSSKITINGISSTSGNIDLNLSSLSDIALDSLSDAQILKYDNFASKWKNSNLNVQLALNNLLDVAIADLTVLQVLRYNGSKWENATLNLITNINNLEGVVISNVSDQQVLQYDNASSKWKNATLNLVTNISSLSDVTITSIADGNLLIYSSSASKWINSNTIPDNISFIKDDLDGTKKLQFQLSGITTGQTRTLTVPDASCVIVGDTNTQTLTNKTLIDSTNNIMAKSLKSATTTIDVSSATAPSNGQVLMATSSTTATWQTPSSITA